ncbi:M15 family metallopeptidase [Falsiroseomonas sp. HW251]|uniref:M15 family metallopeptidase n=1 Tax=Falsiroseomonas sp. HW251 TaxID=3390998 RepID=UPI003D318D92
MASRRALIAAALPALAGCAAPAIRASAAAPRDEDAARLARLVAAYPAHLRGMEGGELVWADGTRMPSGAGLPARPFEAMLRDATIADQLRQDYAPGPLRETPPPDHSPGRIRHASFFRKLYGDCRDPRTAPPLTRITWMPRTRPQAISVTTVNDVHLRLARVIEALEALPDAAKAFLVPSAGTFNCRDVADTGLPSMHASGAAIDIGTRGSDYWAWSRPRGAMAHRNRIPGEIVEAFEAERFIWGGKWWHYDTMHFEYRPELIG